VGLFHLAHVVLCGRRQAVMAGRSAVDLQNPWWEKSTAPNMKSIESVEQLITELVRCCRDVYS